MTSKHPPAPILPPTKVEVNSSPSDSGVVVNVNLSRESYKSKDFLGEGRTSDEATKNVIEKILGDKTSGEYIK